MFLFPFVLNCFFTVWDLLKASYMCTYNVPPFIKPSHLIFKWHGKDTAIFPCLQWNHVCRVSQSFISHVSTYCLLRSHTIFVISFVLFLALSLYDLTAVLTELFFVLLFPFLLFSHLCLAGVSFQTAVLMSFFLYFNYYKLGLILNGRSHGNKILKLRKYLASESRAKLAWAMPNAARYSFSKNERPLLLT